jgi:apolipoprotein N-acyltransferase
MDRMAEGKLIVDSKRSKLLLALVAGLLTTASVPPLGWWPLAIVGLGLLPLAFEGAGRRSRFVRGLAFAGGLYIPSLWWMAQFSVPGALVISSIEMVITATCLALLIPNVDDGPNLRAALATAVALVAADALRSLWPFGGLPLGGIDLGQADGPFAALVTFGGRLLLIGGVALLGGALVHAIRGPQRRAGAAIAALCLAATAAAHVLPDGTHAVRTLRIAIAQGSGPLGERSTDAGQETAFRAHVAATKLITKPVDLVLWPENVINVANFSTSTKRDEIGRLATALGAPIIAGAVEDDPDPSRFLNFSIVVGPGGALGDGRSNRYDKVRRVPFGEAVFFRSFLKKFSSALPKTDMRSGTRPGVIATPFGPIAIIISYEGFFDDRARSGVRAGGQALFIPTNASSYTSSHVPTQQLAAARLRARETGRFVAQAAPTGISAIMTPTGAIITRSAIQQRVALQATIMLRRGLTPYARFNDAPALALFGLIGIGSWLAGRRRRT